jgi:hypothetical protein
MRERGLTDSLLAWLAAWWGLGQAIAGFIAWGFLCRWSSTTARASLTSRSPSQVELPESVR